MNYLIFLSILIMPLFCMGIALLFEENMMLESVGRWYQRQKDYYALTDEPVYKWTIIIFKPIIGCPICFASFWGTIAFVLINGISVDLWREWLICCVCTAFINSLLIRI